MTGLVKKESHVFVMWSRVALIYWHRIRADCLLRFLLSCICHNQHWVSKWYLQWLLLTNCSTTRFLNSNYRIRSVWKTLYFLWIQTLYKNCLKMLPGPKQHRMLLNLSRNQIWKFQQNILSKTIGSQIHFIETLKGYCWAGFIGSEISGKIQSKNAVLFPDGFLLISQVI